MLRLKTTIIILITLLTLVSSLSAQLGSPFNQRDDQYRVLGLKRAKEIFEVAKANFDRQQKLFDKSLISISDLDRSRSQYADAEVNYQQSLLAVLFEKQYVSVAKAVKYQTQSEARHVKLTLVNTSGGTAEFRKLINIDDALFRSLQPDVVNNVYVSLLNDDGAIISDPYEAKLDQLIYGHPEEISFTLLQDVDVVTVALTYSNGVQRNMKIFLQKDNSVNRVAVQSEQFSQEVELGEKASFGLSLELFSASNNTFSLEVVGLPKQIGRVFKDRSGSARLSQVKFAESAQTKRASLEISLPDRPTSAVLMDQPIPFYVVVLPRSQVGELAGLDSQNITEEDLNKLGAGYVKLELIPRGKGELRVRSPQLYYSIDAGDVVEMNIEVINEGSHRIDNIEVKVDMPLNWTKSIDPTVLTSLEINEDSRINLKFTPPDDIAVGKYEVRLRTSGLSNNQPITGEDKTVTIEIKPETNLLGTLLIVLMVVGLVGGIVTYGIKLSRR